jgi:tetratricopeptide (TPR) repeat protein
MPERPIRLSLHNFEERRLEVEMLLGRGQTAVARERLQALEAAAQGAQQELGRIAELYTRAGRHAEALRCQRGAAALAPRDPRVLYNLSAALIAVGELAEAEHVLTEVIALDPHDADAYYNRATLRKQTPDRNHVAEILAELDSGERPASAVAGLCYAVSKELEDLGECTRAFEYLKRGADARRKRLTYRVEADEATMAAIAQAFDRSHFSPAAMPVSEQPAPGFQTIFVIGLPRSGTTLVDRILSSHTDVESLGEINDFALSMMRILGNVADKGDLIERAAAMNFRALGEAYLTSVAGYERTRARFIDKTPLNYLYLGLIHLALPGARVIHLRRHPMDSCLAMYRTLFRMGYPFSYDLTDLGRYYLAYHRLMEHWRTVAPGAMLAVDYEAVIENQEAESRRILEYCGLAWQPQCLDFHLNDAPVATASAAQVRQPIYTSSLARWRRYERELAPLAEILVQGGIDIA